jgi:hypothetical protein
MNSLRFRPGLEGLEDRTTPTTIPSDVIAALGHAEATQSQLRQFYSELRMGRTDAEMERIPGQLQAAAQASRDSAAVLGNYLAQLQAQLPANPGLGQLAGGVGYGLYVEVINAAYADYFAESYGAVPAVPPPPVVPPPAVPPPPEAPSPPSPPSPPTIPIADIPATLSTTMPDVNAADWQEQPNGLKIWDVGAGSGAAVAEGDNITVNYTGWLASNGTKFDSSQDPGRTPLTSPLDTASLIEGWVLGVPGMQVGTVRRLYIPSELAYGSRSRPGIPPNSDLVFEIQLLSFT